MRCRVVDHRITGTSTTPPSAVPTPTRNGPPPPRSIFSEMKFHAAVNPTQTNVMPPRYIQNRGASRKTAPTAPSRPSCCVRVRRIRLDRLRPQQHQQARERVEGQGVSARRPPRGTHPAPDTSPRSSGSPSRGSCRSRPSARRRGAPARSRRCSAPSRCRSRRRPRPGSRSPRRRGRTGTPRAPWRRRSARPPAASGAGRTVVSARCPSTGLQITARERHHGDHEPDLALVQAAVLQEQREEREEARPRRCRTARTAPGSRRPSGPRASHARPGIRRRAFRRSTAARMSDGRPSPEIAHRPCGGGSSGS